ncbi:hypothetical protein GCM10022227_43530 [Streptomyces sedi]
MTETETAAGAGAETAETTAAMRVEIWGDIVCPWTNRATD